MDWHMVRAASCLNDLVFAIYAIDVTLKMAISSMTGLATYAARTQPSSRDFMDCTPQAGGVYTLQGCLAWSRTCPTILHRNGLESQKNLQCALCSPSPASCTSCTEYDRYQSAVHVNLGDALDF